MSVDGYWRAVAESTAARARYQAAEAALGYGPEHDGTHPVGLRDAAFVAIGRWEDWLGVVYEAQHTAEVAFFRAIVLWSGADESLLRHVENRAMTPAAVIHQGRVYLATPLPDGDNRMHLMVADLTDDAE